MSVQTQEDATVDMEKSFETWPAVLSQKQGGPGRRWAPLQPLQFCLPDNVPPPWWHSGLLAAYEFGGAEGLLPRSDVVKTGPKKRSLEHGPDEADDIPGSLQD